MSSFCSAFLDFSGAWPDIHQYWRRFQVEASECQVNALKASFGGFVGIDRLPPVLR
jgi:hypothetical protein